jgi:hypothetical protein
MPFSFMNPLQLRLVFQQSLQRTFKAPIYFWAQDLWPESLVAAGGVKNRFVLRVF